MWRFVVERVVPGVSKKIDASNVRANQSKVELKRIDEMNLLTVHEGKSYGLVKIECVYLKDLGRMFVPMNSGWTAIQVEVCNCKA